MWLWGMLQKHKCRFFGECVEHLAHSRGRDNAQVHLPPLCSCAMCVRDTSAPESHYLIPRYLI